MKRQLVTFETLLVPGNETAKGWCILGGEYRPKSLCSVEYISDEYLVPGGKDRKGRPLGPIAVRRARITMPEWLAKK